jgi:glycosyltransferase involved in cell wall biosynthesis
MESATGAAAGEPVVTVIVAARDAGATLGDTLVAIRAQELDEPFEVVVVDDGSRDGTSALARAHAPLVTVLRNEVTAGPGAARNRGAQAARAPVLAFTDADCVPTPRWLAEGLAAISTVDLVQGAVAPDPRAPRRPFDRTLQVNRITGFYQTANLLVRRSVFDRVGGFRDWSLDGPRWLRGAGFGKRTPMGEDALFSWTARRAGARTGFAPEALVHHAVFPGRVRDEMGHNWHWTKYMPGLARLVPELREVTFYKRWFFSPRTARFDLAVVGLAAATARRREVYLAAAIPYVRWLAIESRRWGGRPGIEFALGTPFSDAAALCGFVVGSLAWRSLVL